MGLIHFSAWGSHRRVDYLHIERQPDRRNEHSSSFIKITSSHGKLMEMSPRPADVTVVRPIGESYTGHDVQLETAVRELLKQIGDNRHRCSNQRSPSSLRM